MQEATEDFIGLFKEAFKKCFGADMQTSLSETECKHFSNEILDKTGLVIGAKSLKNYSVYVLNPTEAKPENPSVATLDTLARYVLAAPYINEINRKDKEAHYPYWFQYRNNVANKTIAKSDTAVISKAPAIFERTGKKAIFFTVIIVILILVGVFYFFTTKKNQSFTDNFYNVNNDWLKDNGWILLSGNKTWWNKRNEIPSHLTLYTLTGDNWADSAHAPDIKNLLLRKITSDCFTAEVHFDGFVPMHRWQQAGILLMEDSNFKAKSLRISFAYNDFFGGYNKPKEIIVQGITSGENDVDNPEEIIHLPVFSIDEGQDSLVASNLKKSALRIEKNGTHYRFLYATGQAGNFAFKEALTKELSFQPKYIGIFALQGFINTTTYLPVHFKYFSLTANACNK